MKLAQLLLTVPPEMAEFSYSCVKVAFAGLSPLLVAFTTFLLEALVFEEAAAAGAEDDAAAAVFPAERSVCVAYSVSASLFV